MKNISIILHNSCKKLNIDEDINMLLTDSNIGAKFGYRLNESFRNIHSKLTMHWNIIMRNNLNYNIRNLIVVCYIHLFNNDIIRKRDMTSDQIDILNIFELLETAKIIQRSGADSVIDIPLSIKETAHALLSAIEESKKYKCDLINNKNKRPRVPIVVTNANQLLNKL